MDLQRLAECARELQALLNLHVSHADVRALQNALAPWIADALAGRIAEPLEWRDIPGGRSFTETDLGRIPGLEDAFAKFRIELTGGESPALRRLREQMRHEDGQAR